MEPLKQIAQYIYIAMHETNHNRDDRNRDWWTRLYIRVPKLVDILLHQGV